MKLKEINGVLPPREKIIKYGVEELTDEELLAVILSVGNKNESVLELSKRIIEEYGFQELFLMDYDNLISIDGIKMAKACKLMVVFEIARRVMNNKVNKPLLDTTNHAAMYLKQFFDLYNYEKIVVLYCNCKLELIHKKIYSSNDSHQVLFPLKEIIKDAIHFKAYGIIISHNHPSGEVYPSENDINTTDRLELSLKAIDVLLLDHIIISNKKYYSFTDNRCYNFK